MNKILLLLVFLLTNDFSSQSEIDNSEWKEDRDINNVDQTSFENFLETHPMTLLMVYDGANPSKDAMEMLPELQEEFKKANIKIWFAKMHKDHSSGLPHQWKVYHYPYFRFIIGGGVSATLRDFPDIDNLFNWVARIYKRKIKIIEVNSAHLKDQFNKEKKAFYLRYDPSKDNYYDLLKKLKMIAKKIPVYYSTNPTHDVFENYNKEDIVVGFRGNFEEKVKFLSSPNKLDRDIILQFFHTYMEPKTVRLTEDLLNKIMTKRRRTAFYFGKNEHSVIREAFILVAFEQKQNIMFVIVDHDDQHVDEMRQYLKVDQNAEDEIRIIEHDGSDFKVYRVDGKTEADIVKQFDKFNNKELEEIHDRETHNDDIIGEL